MIRGPESADGQGSCTAVPIAVEILLEMPPVGEDVTSLFEVLDGCILFAGGIEEPGSFR